MKRAKSILSSFDSVSLKEIEEVKLMNRMDRKYWFHLSLLYELLEKTIPYYNILEINGQRLMEYKTSYFDTFENSMYLTHHNGKCNRYKVRRRNYVSTDSGFFEIKRRNSKNRIIKERIEAEFNNKVLSQDEQKFITDKSPFQHQTLKETLNNSFYRLTLIHKENQDRCTIDLKPKFWNEKGEIQFDNLVIFELKRGRNLMSSPVILLLREMKIRQRGLSKYCTGRAMLESGLKQNSFKSRLRFIDKNIVN